MEILFNFKLLIQWTFKEGLYEGHSNRNMGRYINSNPKNNTPKMILNLVKYFKFWWILMVLIWLNLRCIIAQFCFSILLVNWCLTKLIFKELFSCLHCSLTSCVNISQCKELPCNVLVLASQCFLGQTN